MIEELERVIKEIDQKFTSWNEIPVSRAPMTRAEWELIRPILVEATQRYRGM